MLRENLIKLIVERVVDLVAILISMFFLYFLLVTSRGVPALLITVGILVGYWIVSILLEKAFEGWEVPELEKDGRRKMMKAEIYISIIALTLVIVILSFFQPATSLVFGAIALVFVIILEWRRWQKFNKEEIEKVVNDG